MRPSPTDPFSLPEFNLPKFDLQNLKLPGVSVIIGIAVLLWLASGIYKVGIDEKGVVLRFGKHSATTDPGLRYHFPWPFETVFKPKVTEVKRIEIGFRTIDPGPPARYRDVSQESLMLTGDENIVDLDFIVQYRIVDPVKYLFNVRNIVQTLRSAAEAAIRETTGGRKIDEALTTGKFRLQEDTRKLLQEVLDKYETGLKVVAVQLQDVNPPKDVVASFKDVASAREDRQRLIREAQAYQSDLLPKARGQAAAIIHQAGGYAEEKERRARGDAQRFLQILKEYSKAKDVTRQRLFLETMEEILPEIEKYIVSSGDSGNLLQFLPLTRQSAPVR